MLVWNKVFHIVIKIPSWKNYRTLFKFHMHLSISSLDIYIDDISKYGTNVSPIELRSNSVGLIRIKQAIIIINHVDRSQTIP